jgi:hypothetical protein
MCVDSGATGAFVVLGTPLKYVRKCKPIEVEVTAGACIWADERGDFDGYIKNENGTDRKVTVPCIRGDFN